MIRSTISICTASIALAAIASIAPVNANGTGELHAPFDRLLRSYVRDDGVRYAAWAATDADVAALSAYVDELEAVDTDGLPPADELSYWINLYNAVTLELILDHYPLDSIKDIGGVFSSPWKRDLVTVGGEKLSLDEIENEVIRKRFSDARIHFALNCASVGCPPLIPEAYVAERLDAQLQEATVAALNDTRWVNLEGERAAITKLFDWYEEDFVAHSGSVAAFIADFREEPRDGLVERLSEAETFSYDWQLNEAAP